MDRLNLFNPFGRQRELEDRLTWAFLATLKYDPLLQNFLRDLVQSRLPFELPGDRNPWEPTQVSTQTQWIEPSSTLLVSVLLTDESVHEEIRVRWSDGKRRYDGMIAYPDGKTLIIENKLHHGDVWKEQLSPSRQSFPNGIDGIELHEWAVCLEWPEVLEGVLRYTKSSMPPFGNRELAGDLLSFVDEIHPALTPYRTFELCDNRPEALERRVYRLVGDIAGLTGVEDRVDHLYRPGKIAQRIHLWIHPPKGDPWGLRAGLWSASTAGQANAFLEVLRMGSRRDEFLSLNGREGWHVEPNLNFSYRGTKLVWVASPCGVADYLGTFFSGERPYGRKQWDELAALMPQWERQGIIGPQDRDRIEAVRGNRTTLDVNPEFQVYRDWDRDTVMALEEQGQLAAQVRDALAIPLATWGEMLG